MKPKRLHLGITVYISSWLFVVGSLRAEPLLAARVTDDPAFHGLLGEQGHESFSFGGILWHRNGYVFAVSDHTKQLSVWRTDVQKNQVSSVFTFESGDEWCVSHRGDFLCARAPAKDDEVVRGASAWGLGAFSCYRLQDRARIWKLPMRKGETIEGAAYTPDDKMVAILSNWENQLSLRLLDAASGQMVREHVFPGRNTGANFWIHRLTMRANELWTYVKEPAESNDESKLSLVRIPLSTLTPSKVQCDYLDHFAGAVRPSQDGKYLLCEGSGHVTCLRFSAGQWRPVFEDNELAGMWDAETERLREADFLPDGRLVLITSENARITELDTKKTHQIKLGYNFGGTISPEGTHLLIAYPHGFKLVNVAATEAGVTARLASQHWPASRLSYSKDGLSLLAADTDGITVWDIASKRPRARLTGFETHDVLDSSFEDFSLFAGETQVLSAENDDFVLWKLPPLQGPMPKDAVFVKPELAFGGVRSPAGGPYARAFADEDARWFITVKGVGTVMGSASRPASIYQKIGPGPSVTTKEKIPHSITPGLGFFRQDDSYIFHGSTGWSRIDLKQATLTRLPSLQQDVQGVLPRREFQLLQGKNGGLYAASFDGKNKLPAMEWPLRSDRISMNDPVAVSSDEKLCATSKWDRESNSLKLLLWEIETGKLLGSAATPRAGAYGLAISPDGKQIACAHKDTSISLWDVTRMQPPPSKAPEKLKTAPSTAPSANSAPAALKSTSPVARGLNDHVFGSGRWEIRENGTVSQGERLPEAGLLRVNTQNFTPKKSELTFASTLKRYFNGQQNFHKETLLTVNNDKATRPLPQSQHSSISAGLMHLCEGPVAEGVWAARQIGNVRGSLNRYLTFTDTFINVSDQERRIDVEFSLRLSARTQSFLSSDFKPVPIDPDGTLRVPEDAVWIAAVSSDPGTRLIPILVFRGENGGQNSRLVWKQESHTLVTLNDALLVPGEVRHLMHSIRIHSLPEGAAPQQLQVPPFLDFCRLLTSDAVLGGMNFSYTPDLKESLAIKRSSWKCPDLLSGWDMLYDGSFSNSSSIASLCRLWIDDAPMPGAAPGLFLLSDSVIDVGSSLQVLRRPTHFSMKSLDGRLTVVRNSFIKDNGPPLISDTITNSAKEPAKTRLSFVTDFSQPVKAVYDANCNPVSPSKEAVSAMALGGACIVEFDGPDRPSTAFLFYEPGARAEPKISWPAPKILKIEYEVEVPPLRYVEFRHGATQRPLASFSSIKEAYTGVLPFKHGTTYHRDYFMNIK